MDSNKDGQLSEKEAEGPLANDFAKIDSNNDGFITLRELNKVERKSGGRPPRQNNHPKDLSIELNNLVKTMAVNTTLRR